jgi:hypothetical protein
MESLKERDHLGDLGINGRIILKLLKEIRYEDMGRILVILDRVQWQYEFSSIFRLSLHHSKVSKGKVIFVL